ncbi:MAG: lipid A export permease/ATP-binding protein MsbA [Pseudomonadota bacterium]|nr:lipid A export permease/ATP-binding protein MsbA [Pseudomonadota bacterium]
MPTPKPDYGPMAIYKRLLAVSATYWVVFIGVGFSAAIFAATDTGFAYLMKTVTEIVAADNQLNPNQAFLKKWLPIGVLLLFTIRGVANFLSTYGMGWIARKVVKELRGRVFSRYIDLPTAFFDQNSSGQLLSKLTYDVTQVAESASNAIIILFKDTLTILVLMFYMVYLSAPLSSFVFIVAPIIALIVRFLGNIFRRHSQRIQASMGEITRIAEEVLQGHKVVKIFGGQKYENNRFESANENNRRMEMRMLATRAGGDAITVLVSAFGVAGVIFLISRIDISVGEVAGFITAMVLLMGPLKRLTNVNASIQRGIAAGESLFQAIDAEAERDQGTLNIDRAIGNVEFRNVSFTYSSDKSSVLKNISLTVNEGETVAVVGKSGSGKSTLVSLLPRFYDVDSGEIYIDDHPISEYTLSSLRNQISLVSQEVTLFNDTIAANISYGVLSSIGHTDLERAVKAAYVDEFIEEMPKGLNTLVGDRGVLLSGGQRQRISIARALLKNAPILVLDEATSALDTESERHIQAALDKLMQNRTTLVIAHRLSTIEKADRIVVMSDGRTVESGRHSDLLSLNGTYAALHQLQFKEDASNTK